MGAAFDIDSYIKKQDQPPSSAPKGFDINAYISQGADTRIKSTRLESAAQGALKGVSLGWNDEAEAALRAGGKALGDVASFKGLPNIVKDYKDFRTQVRARDELAKEDNPGSYMAGEVAGNIGSAFLPGVGQLGIAKAPGVLSKLVAAAKIGGVMGAGQSTADVAESPLNIGNLIEDTATGAATGAATQGVLSAGGKILSTVTPTSLAKKAANVFLNTPENVTGTYIQNPQGVLNAPKNFELANSIETKGLDPLKKLVLEGSAESRAVLDAEGKTVKGSTVSDIANAIGDRIEKRLAGINDDPERVAALKWIRNIASEYGPKPTGEMTISADGSAVPVLVDKIVDTNRLKDTVQTVGKSAKWDTGGGQFVTVDDGIRKEFRAELDQILKESPAYTEAMKQTASDTNLLKDVNQVASSPRGWANVFRRLETDKYGSGQLPAATLKALDERLGTDFVNQATLSNAREAFDKSITNGSRNVNFFSNWLKDVPILKHIAPLIGATVDKYGREITMKAVDGAVVLNQLYNSNNVKNFMSQAAPIIEAASKGDPAAIITFQFLEQTDPKAMQYIKNQEAMRRRSQ